MTHIAANSLVGSGTGHTHHGCDRAVHLVKNDWIHRGTCVTHPYTGTCNIGQYGPSNVYYEFSCTHHTEQHSGYVHHWHNCKKQSTGAHMVIDWHRH